MIIINPDFFIEVMRPKEDMYFIIEKAGRTCYKSNSIPEYGSSGKFIKKLIRNGHESVLEHASISVRIICSRAISHELVRHRIASYSQESQRYCNYSDARFGSGITFVKPMFDDKSVEKIWEKSMQAAELAYFEMLENGVSPQYAREVLPNSTKTEIVITANIREWRHIFNLRCSVNAHPEMRRIMNPMLSTFTSNMPELFEDILDKLDKKSA